MAGSRRATHSIAATRAGTSVTSTAAADILAAATRRARDAVRTRDLGALSAVIAEHEAHATGQAALPYSLILAAAKGAWDAGLDQLIRHSSSSVVSSALFRLVTAVRRGGDVAVPPLERVLQRADGKAQRAILKRVPILQVPACGTMLDRIWDNLRGSARKEALVQWARAGSWTTYRARCAEYPLNTDGFRVDTLLAMVDAAETVPLDLFQAAYEASPKQQRQVLKEAARDSKDRLVAWMCEHHPQDEDGLVDAVREATRYDQTSTIGLLLNWVPIQVAVGGLAQPDQIDLVDVLGCAAGFQDRAWLLEQFPEALPRTALLQQAQVREAQAQTQRPPAGRSGPRRRS